MDIVIFGSGKFYNNRKEKFRKDYIVAFLDNDKKKQGTYKDNTIIMKPENVCNLEYDYIVLASIYADEMKEQLINYGVEEDKICYFQEYEDMDVDDSYEVKFYGWSESENQEKKILLLSHELSLTGAPVVVFQLAKLLKQCGYHVVVGSMKDGELRIEFLSEHIPVVICSNVKPANKFFYNFVEEFDFVLANTITFNRFINVIRKKRIPVVWWIHDIVTPDTAKKTFPVKKIAENITVYAGGKLVKDAYIESYDNTNIETLLYGVEDRKKIDYQKRKQKKLIFAVVASIQPRKGQDIFINAIKRLPDNLKKKAEFWIIGRPANQHVQEFVKQLENDSNNMPCIKFLGEVDTAELWKLYEKIDVVVAPSRKDPMPVVVTNGFMLNKVCIVSETTGQAEFVTDGKDGFVFKDENVVELSDKMQWLLTNQEQIETIGENARKLYENEFSMNIFEKRILKIIDDKIGEVGENKR